MHVFYILISLFYHIAYEKNSYIYFNYTFPSVQLVLYQNELEDKKNQYNFEKLNITFWNL